MRRGDALCLHSVYTSYKVYAGDRLLATEGDDKAPFMLDPPTEVHSISLDGLMGKTNFRIVAETPAVRSSIYLYQPIIGSEFSILFHLSSLYGISMVLSIAFLFLGAGLSLLSLAFRSFDLRGRRVLYPGLLALAGGTWQFAENALTVYLTQSPSVMYVLAFTGMMVVPLPLIRLTMISADGANSRFLNIMLHGLQAAILLALVLQFLGVVQLCQSSAFFSVALPAVIIALTVYTYRALFRTRDRSMARYAVAITLLAIGSFLELINYQIHIFPMVSWIFQIFLLGFIAITAVAAAAFAKRVYRESLEKLKLESDVQMLEQSIDSQKQRNEMLLQHEQELRRLRHDLRHHYVYVNELAQEGRYDELSAYVAEMGETSASLIKTPRTFCENVIANSLVSHYADIADERGYRFTALLDLPAEMPNLSDSDLCVVIGNLLENAVESCARLKESDPSSTPEIDLKARTQGPRLFITLDNSLSSAPKRTARGFATSKKDSSSHGIGLQSIQAIAQKHDGEASFTADAGMFHSSLYLTM